MVAEEGLMDLAAVQPVLELTYRLVVAEQLGMAHQALVCFGVVMAVVVAEHLQKIHLVILV